VYAVVVDVQTFDVATCIFSILYISIFIDYLFCILFNSIHFRVKINAVIMLLFLLLLLPGFLTERIRHFWQMGLIAIIGSGTFLRSGHYTIL
jgi:hypothetical protein